MDGLSGLASAIAVIQITWSICSLLKDYYEGVRDARDDIDSLYKAVRILGLILSEIEGLIKKHVISVPQDLLEQCNANLKELKAEVLASITEKGGGKRHKVKAFKWPFKKPDVAKRVAVIERHKSALSVFLSLEHLYVLPAQFPSTWY